VTHAFALAESDLRIDYYRGHGKGGQHRNKTSSAVRLTHLPTGEVVAIERGRSQIANLERARRVLEERLHSAHGEAAKEGVNNDRRAQVSSAERAAKQWTWNEQRDEVINHESGVKGRMRECLRGLFSPGLLGE
jgi:peptide chain release factor 1